MRILGIDPGLNVTGYGVIDIQGRQLQMVEARIVCSKRTDTLAQRVAEIHAGVSDVISILKPDGMALEQLYSHYERPQTAILMGHARGIICLAAAQAGIDVQDYAATQIKKTLTGNGRAPKSQVQLAIQRELQLSQLPEPADVADALAIALTHIWITKLQLQT